MTARTVAEPSRPSAPSLPIPTGAPLLKYFSASLDRRSLIMVASSHHRPVTAAVEADGSLSTRFFYAVDPSRPGAHESADASETTAPSFNALDSGTIQLAHALRARQAAAEGGELLVDRFALEVLGRRGARWREAVSTALLGEWAAPLKGQGRLGLDDLARLRREAEALHRQLIPLWRRRTLGHRLLMLDTPLGDGLTLYDLVAGRPQHLGAITEGATGDSRIDAVLGALHPQERAVAMAWAQAAVRTWAEAALVVGAADPVAAGERVRRKLKRLAARHRQRAAASAATRAAAS
ncbi:hypothetical protein ACIHJG_39790 [Streptomyces sp. NPDC052415]|uniref:hypothetical protein n=1 Tax=Streptomyces sp. NPDC052415 TaxID=3365690 RepID=UPI0037D5F6AA